MEGKEWSDTREAFLAHRAEKERRERLGAAANYLAGKLGQEEVAGKLGGSGPPTGGSSGAPDIERAELFGDLQKTSQDLLA